MPAIPLKDAKLHREKCYVDGAWIDADAGETTTVQNPATGQPVGTVPRLGAAEMVQPGTDNITVGRVGVVKRREQPLFGDNSLVINRFPTQTLVDQLLQSQAQPVGFQGQIVNVGDARQNV